MAGLGTGAPIVQVYHEKSIILPDVSRVLACLYEKDIKFKTHTASYRSLLRLQASSHAPVPFYDGPTFLEDSREICRYIAETYEDRGYPFLLGKDALERASVEQWLHNEEHAFNPPSRALLSRALLCHLAFPLEEDDGDDIEMNTRKLEEVLDVYEQRLGDNEFLAGNKFTLADLVHLPNSHYITSGKFLYLYDSRKNVRRWWDSISIRPSWQQVLRDMKMVEEQHKQEELEKHQQLQHQQIEHRTTSGHPIRLDPRKQIGTEPRTLLFPPAHIVLSSPTFSKTEEPPPTDTFPNEDLVSSSQSTTSDKTSSVQSKETTIFTTPQETTPTSVQSTPTTPKKSPIPVQSLSTFLAPVTSPTAAEKPPIVDAAKSTEMDLRTRHKPGSPRDVSNNLDVLDYYNTSSLTEEGGATSPIQKRQANIEDTTGQSRDVAFKPKQMIGQDDQDNFKETKAGDPSLLQEQSQEQAQIIPAGEKAEGSTTKHQRASDALDEKSSTTARARAKTRDDFGEEESYKEDTTDDQKVVPPLLSTEPTSRVQPLSESLQEASPHGSLSAKPSTIHQWQRASASLNDATTSSGDDEIGMPTIDKKLTPMSQQGTFSAEGANQMAEDSDEKSLEPPVPTEAETSGVQRASPSFPGASTAHHATIDDKFAKQSIIEDARDKGRKSSETIPERQKMVETKTGASGEQPSDRLKATSPSRQEAAEHARDATGDTIWPPDIVDTSMKSRGTFEEAKGPSSTLPKAQSLGAQDTDVNRTGLGSLSSEGKDAEATMGEVQSFSTQQLGEMLKKSESTIPKAQPTDFQGPIKEEKASSIYQKKPLVAQDSREQAQTIPAGEKADGSTPKHQQASDALYTFDEKSSASAPARAKSQDDHSAEEPYRKDTTNDQKVAPPILSKEPNSRVQPSSEPSQDTAPHGDLHSKPSTIDQWQRASAPLHDVATSSGDNEMAMSAIDQKPTPRSQQETFSADFTNQMAKESGNQRVEPLMPIGAETSDVKRPSPSFPTASIADDANIDDKLAKQSITDERAREPIQMQAPSPDAHPASAPGKRATPEGHEIGGQMSEVTKASDDLATVHEDIYDTNLSTHDLAKDTFKETKVAESTPSSAKPIYTQQPATASRLAEVEEARDKGRQSRETIPEQQNMVERKSGVSEEQSSDHLKAIRPSRLAESEDARGATGDTIQSPDILDTTKKSRGTFEEIKGPGSTLPKAQSLGAQGAQRTSVESTTPTADQRKDISTKPQSNVQDVFQQSKLSSTDQKGSEGKDAEAIMTEEKSFSTERPRGMLKENELTIPKAQPTDSQGSITEEETSSVYQKRPLATQDSGKQSQIIPVGADGSTLKPQQASDAPYTFDEKSSASAPARADIHDDDSAEEPYKKDTTDDQKVAPPLLSKEPSQDAAPHGDLSSKPSTVDQWQRASAPLHGASTNSGDTEMATPSTIDQKPTPMSQEATLSSQSVNQVAGQSGEQRVEPPVPIKTETSDLPRAAPSFPEAATADNVTIDNKFAKQPTIDERLGEPKQMQAPITDAHPAPAPTKRTTPDGHETGDLELAGTSEGQRLEAAKAIQDPATIHDDAHDANLSTHYAAIGEKAATYRASGDQLVTGSLHDQQALPPALTQAQPPVDTPHDSASSQYVHTDALGKTELAKPTETDQEATTPIAGPTSREPQLGSTLPAEVALAEQKSALSEQESTRAAQPFSPVEPVKMDSNISAADYTNAPQIIFQQQARPSAPSTREVPASDAQGVVRKIQEVTPSDHHTDDSGRPLVPSQEQVSQASQAIPGREDITSSPGARDYPTSDTQLALGKVHELSPDSHVGSAFGPGEVGPAEKKFAPSDQDLAHSAEQPLSGEPRKEQTVVPSAEQIKALPTVIGQQGTPDTREGLTSEDSRVTIPTHGDVHPTSSIDAAGRPLSVQGEEVETQHGAAPDQIAFDEQKFASSGQGSADTAYPASAPDTQHGTALDKVAVNQQKFSPSGQDSVHSVQPSSSTEPTKENTAIGATDQTSTPQQIIDQKDTVPAPDKAKTPFSGTHDASRKMQRSTDDDLIDESLPNQGQVSPDKHASEPREGHTTDSYRTNVDEKTTTSSSSQLFSSEAGSDSIPTRRDVRPSMGGEPTEPFPPGHEPQSLAATQDVSLDALGKSKSTGPEAMAPTLDLASVPHTQHGSPQREAAPAEQKFAASDEESSHVSEPASSAEPRKGETNVAAADQPNVPQPIVSNQVTALTPDAREALLKDQEPPRGDDYTSNLASPLTVSQEQASDEGSTPEVHSNLADKKTTLPSSEAQTSNAGPDSAPTGADAHLSSGDVPATSSLPATRVPTIQDLQGSASAQDVPTDSSGKVKSPRQISIDQVMAPIMSPSVPSAAPLGTAPGTNSVQHPRQAPMAPIVDMASVPDTQHGIPQGETSPAEQKFAVSDQESPHTLEPPSSAEPRKVETNAAAADQPNVPQDPQTTIDHQVKAPELDAREALRKDELPSHHDDHISNLADSPIAGEEQSSPAGHASELRGRPTPEMRSAGVEKKTLPSSRAQTSDTGTDSTHISSDANLSSGDLPATSYLQNQEAQPPVETQEPTIQALQGSASTQNIFLRKIESQRQPSTDQVMASSAAPSDAPQGTEPGANLVQPPQQASMAPMVDLASTPDTQHDIPQGEAAPVEQKIAVFDQESVHTSEPPSSAEPRKEESNAVAADQLNVPQGLQTTIGHQVEAPAPDARDALQKDQQPSHDDDDVSNLANPLIASQEQTPAGRASELHDGPISGIRSAVVDRKTAPPSSQAHTSDTRLDSTPTSVDAHLSRSDVPATSYSQNQEAHAPVAIQAPTNQSLQGSASAQNISLGKIESPRQPSTDQVMASSAASSDAPQGTEPGKNSVRPPQEASIDLPSDEKTSTTQGDQVKTLLNGDLSTSEAVWQSESAVSKGNFQKNLEGASTDEKSKAQKQTDQSDTQSSKGRNKEANGAVRPNISTTFGEPPKQPSWPEETMESSEEPERQQQADQAIVQSLQGNNKEVEETKSQDIGTDEPKERESPENTNQKNNRISQVEASDHSGKEALGVQLLGKNTKGASNSPEDALGDNGTLNKSEGSLGSSEESKVQQTEGKTQVGETEAPSSESEQPKERGLPENNYQINSSQSQAEASDKSIGQSPPGIQNKNKNSSRLDGPTDATNSGDMEDDSQ